MNTQLLLERSNTTDKSLCTLKKLNHLWVDQLLNRRQRLTKEWVSKQTAPRPNIAGKYFFASK